MYLFLFSLAFIGFIICLVKAIKNKKHNIPAKKYAILTVALFVLAAAFSNMNDKKKTDSDGVSADSVAVVKKASVNENDNSQSDITEISTEISTEILKTTELQLSTEEISKEETNSVIDDSSEKIIIESAEQFTEDTADNFIEDTTEFVVRTTEEESTEPIISTTEEKTTERHELDFIVNTNTGKIHLPNCKSVKKMADHNKMYYTGTLEELKQMGYTPCQNCLKGY